MLRLNNRFFAVLGPNDGGGASGGAGSGAGGGAGGDSGGSGDGGGASGGAGGAGGAGGDSGASWLGSFPADLKGYVELKGFKDPVALASSYKELEKAIGVPKEKLLRLPDKDDDPAWNDIFSKLGRPEKPENYEVKVPAGMPDDFAKWAQENFHKLGITKKQGETLAAKWAERIQTQQQEAVGKAEIAQADQLKALKTEWGAAAVQNAKIVDDFTAAAGIDAKTQEKIEAVLGVDGYSKLMHGIVQKFGIKLGEDQYHGPSGGGSNSFGVLSPNQAKARIQELQSDPEWTKRYTNGGEKENREFTQLFAWAYPDQQDEQVFT